MRFLFPFLIVISAVFQSSCQNTESGSVKNLSAPEFRDALSANKQAQLIDVRTQKEYRERHLKGSTLMNINEPGFMELIAGLDKNKPVMVYCLGGGRSSAAAEKMKAAGFKEIYNLKGGILEWTSAGLPVETTDKAGQQQGMTPTDLQTVVQSKPFVLVDYQAVWCGPCKKIAPILQKFEADHKEQLMLYKVDADDNPGLLRTKQIQSIPYLELYKDGKLIWQHAGLISEEELREAAGF